MVSITEKLAYLEKVRSSQKVWVFYLYISGLHKNESLATAIKENDDLFFGVVRALINDDKKEFETLYETKSASNPSTGGSLPFINDDYLIFVFIVGITRFGISQNWIQKVLAARKDDRLTRTFASLLKDDYANSVNIPEVVLAHLECTDKRKITAQLLDSAFESVRGQTELLEGKRDILIISALTAFDLVVKYKNVPTEFLFNVDVFLKKFDRRIVILVHILQMLFLLSICILFASTYEQEKPVSEFFAKHGVLIAIFGLLGINIAGLFPVVRSFFGRFIKRMLGMPKELLKEGID